MHQAARLQFKRVMDEFVAWRAIAAGSRLVVGAGVRTARDRFAAAGALVFPARSARGRDVCGRRKDLARFAGRPDAGAMAL